MQIENIIFDFDGTLVDSAGDVIDSLKKAYRTVDAAWDVAIDSSHMGPQLKEMISSVTPGLNPGQVEEIIRAFRREYDNSRYPKTRLRPGIECLLKELQDAAIPMFVVTNKPKKATERILKRLHLKHFKAIVNPDTRPGVRLTKAQMLEYLVHQYALVCQRTLVVGDSESDILAARDNQMFSLVVLDGYGQKQNIFLNRPDFIVHRVNELNNFIRELRHHGSSRRIPQTDI